MTDDNRKLGRFERVPLREVWFRETEDFTPWLAREENISLLGETIGIELEVEAQEKNVGPFRADILCQNVGSPHEEWVLIENQLERTDHTHMGQLITYAAGLDAATIVWIAERFSEEHRAAIDWLNEITKEEFHFFGLEIELWRIDKSPPAPKFNIVCKPNEWSKAVQKSAQAKVTEGQQTQLEFWTEFIGFLQDKGYRHSPVANALPRHAMVFPLGRTGLWVATVVTVGTDPTQSELRVEFCTNIKGSDTVLQMLMERESEIEAVLGEKLEWYDRPSVQQKRIILKRRANILEESDRAAAMSWMFEKLCIFQKELRPFVKQLPKSIPSIFQSTNGDGIATNEELVP